MTIYEIRPEFVRPKRTNGSVGSPFVRTCGRQHRGRDTSAAQAKENSFILISPPRVISHSHSKQQWNILIDPSGVAPSVREKIRARFNLPPFDIC